jgi:spore germination protein
LEGTLLPGSGIRQTVRGPIWPYALLSVALIAALLFGLWQTRQKNELALQEENKYMQAFHKLKWTSENLERLTTTLLVTNTPRMQQTLLSDIRVMTNHAVEHMAFLPLLTVNMERTQNFLNTLRKTADDLQYQLGEGEPITEPQWARMAELRKQAVYFEEQMSELLRLVAGGNIRWAATVRVTSPQSSGNGTTPITRAVALLEKNWQAPPGEEGAENPGNAPLKPPPRDIGPRVTEAQAKEAVTKFFPEQLAGDPVITGKQDPSNRLKQFSLYFLSARKKNGTPLDIGVSIHGGHVIYVLDGRPVKEANFRLEDLIPRGQALLQKENYPPVSFISAVRNQNTMILTYAPVDPQLGGVVLLTDLIRVTYSLDNAEILGFDAVPYWQNHRNRDMRDPTLSDDQARALASPRLEVRKSRLALIANRRHQEVLVWELDGTVNGERFLVYINAHDGREESIRRIEGEPAP